MGFLTPRQKRWTRRLALGTATPLLLFCAGAWLYSSASCGCEGATKGQQGLAAIQEGVRSLYPDADYESLTAGQLIERKSIPSDLVRDGKLRHPWKGPVEVGPLPGGKSFVVSYLDLPQDSCIKMAAGNAGAASTGMLAVLINGKPLSLPVNVTDAVDACARQSNDISWTFQ